MYTRKSNLLPFLMWLLPLSFFAYQFILRLWPSLMMQPIMSQFSIDATAFGLLASVYYYGYAGMQIPVAVLLDRFGVRIVVFACASLCALAVFLFEFTTNWYLALLGRFLIGVGSAVGFLGTSKIIAEWFAHEHYGRMVGFSFSIGLLGAIYGGKPTSLLIDRFSGHTVSYVLALVALGIGIFVYLFLRSPVKQEKNSAMAPFSLKDFKTLLSSKSIWWLAIANLLMVGALEGFADVWGVNYLMTAHHLTKSNAAEIVSFIFVGMLFGGPLLAMVSKKWGYYLVISFCGFAMAAAFFCLMIFREFFNEYTLMALFFTIGVMCCYQVLIFAAGHQRTSSKLFGVVVAFLNSVNMLGGSFFHTLIGLTMDFYWQGTMREGIRLYTLASYHRALLIIPFCAMIGGAMVYLVGRNYRE